MRDAVPCCDRYPNCDCALQEAWLEWTRQARRRFWRMFFTFVAVLLAAAVLAATLVGCDEPVRPPAPNDRPSEMYTVIRPS